MKRFNFGWVFFCCVKIKNMNKTGESAADARKDENLR
jgi:hypothetical protein